jgi:uncharacterized protein
MNKQISNFSYKGRRFAIDNKSLAVFEVFKKGFLHLNSEYRQISLNIKSDRNLEDERIKWMLRTNQNRTYCFLNISHSCNMSCVYCFAKGGSYGKKSEIMSIDVAKASIDWILSSNCNKHLIINFFGGEPFVNYSTLYDSIVYAINRCHNNNKKLSIYISTNGTIDFTQIATLLINIRHIFVVSIDGTSDLHNLNRPLRNGNNSYDPIVENIKSYIYHFGSSNLYLRATWRKDQTNLISSVQAMLSLGASRINIGRETSFNMEDSVLLKDNSNDDWKEIVVAYSALTEWYVNKLNNGETYLIQPIFSTIYALFNSTFIRYRCEAGYNKWCIEPSGDVYACHRFVSSEENILGNVKLPYIEFEQNKYILESAFPNFCNDCWIRFWCFSDNCVYLTSIKREFHRTNSFCIQMKEFIKRMIFHTSNLTETGIDTLRSISKLNTN